MLPCNMIRSRQPRPATSSSLRRLPLSPFYYTHRPILCLSPLFTSPNSTHPSQLDTPVPSQPLCYQLHPHTFRHTWGCASVSTFDFELSTLNCSFRKSPHQYHSKCFSRPLFSYSYALFCHVQNANSCILNHLRTLCEKHPRWGLPHSSNIRTFPSSSLPASFPHAIPFRINNCADPHLNHNRMKHLQKTPKEEGASMSTGIPPKHFLRTVHLAGHDLTLDGMYLRIMT